jgi:hypothetical protein
MEQGGYLNEDANISDFTEVNLSVRFLEAIKALVNLGLATFFDSLRILT